MSATLAIIAKALGGEVTGQSVLAPGPNHSVKDRSLSVTLSSIAPDGFIVYSHSGDDWRQCREHVRARLGLFAFKPERHGHITRRDAREPIADDIAKRNAALTLWSRAVDPRGTLVERYLNGRGLNLPIEAAFEAIRFHSRCIDDLPGMVCLVRNIVTNVPQGIHRTALSPDGTAISRNSKTYRKSLGQIADGAIKLDRDEHVEQGLVIGEGLETCLAARQLGFAPVWSAISTRGIAVFPILPGIEGLTILGEVDSANWRDVEACASRWRGLGCEVIVSDPLLGSDLNDVMRGRAAS